MLVIVAQLPSIKAEYTVLLFHLCSDSGYYTVCFWGKRGQFSPLVKNNILSSKFSLHYDFDHLFDVYCPSVIVYLYLLLIKFFKLWNIINFIDEYLYGDIVLICKSSLNNMNIISWLVLLQIFTPSVSSFKFTTFINIQNFWIFIKSNVFCAFLRIFLNQEHKVNLISSKTFMIFSRNL